MPSLLRNLFWKAAIHARWLLPSSRGVGIEIGQRIPDFTLSDFSGQSVTLSKTFPKKAAVLWLTNLCESCEEKISLLQGVHETRGDHVGIFALSTLGEDRATPKRILQTHRMTFPLLMDPQDWVGKELKLEHPAGACPMYNLLILDRTGCVKFRHHLSAIGDKKFLDLLHSI
ncbi:MAG: redoxin domain-containing protein [Elusimicrobia bacterium]|nr:redoxin domain-containing protein [Elusimicrobiota bacterium]